MPLSRLPGANRTFGWQMFSSVNSARYEVVTGDGAAAVDIEDHVLRLRGEVDYRNTLPEHLCTVYPDAGAIRSIATIGGAVEIHPCD